MPEQEFRADRRDRYEGLLRALEHNTGGPEHPQPPGLRKDQLMVNRSVHAGHDADAVEDALEDAREDGEIVRYRDREGQWRYILATVEALNALIGTENMRENPYTALIEWAGEQKAEVRDE